MNPITFLRNSSGIGLLEIMVAIGLSGALAMTISKLMENNIQDSKVIEAKSVNNTFNGQLQGYLGNATACFNTFNTVVNAANMTTLTAASTNTVTVLVVRNKNSTIVFNSAAPNPSILPLTITSMVLTNYSALEKTVDFRVITSFKKSSKITLSPKPIIIKLNFDVAGSTLNSCGALSGGNNVGQWEDMASPALGIFYNMGSVLIGTGTVNTGTITPGFATGTANNVSGQNSSALGRQNTVTGQYSTATGFQNTVAGSGSLTFGMGNSASGDFSLSGGQSSTAAGWGSIAIGSSATTAAGINLGVAIGTQASAQAHRAIAIGSNVTSSGESSMSLADGGGFGTLTNATANAFAARFQAGYNFFNTVNMTQAFRINANGSISSGTSTTLAPLSVSLGATNDITAPGIQSMAVGTSNAIIAPNAFAQGLQNYVSGRYGHAVGYLNTVSAEAGSTFGKGNIASGINAHAVGEANLASGLSSSAHGYYNTASGPYSFASGFNSTASGNSSVALGNGAIASGSNSFAFGSGAEAAYNFSASIIGDSKAAYALGMGYLAAAYGKYSVALGRQAITGASGTPDSPTFGQNATAIGYRATAYHNGSMVLAGQLAAGLKTPSSSAEGKLTMYFPGGIEVCNMLSGGTSGTCLPPGVQWLPGASSWGVLASNKDKKKNFEEIDGKYVLNGIAQLELTTWQYKTQKASDKKRYIGPMAQDFYRLFAKPFSFYSNNQMIVDSDVSGIMLVGIQELEKRTRDLASENTKLKQENALLKEAVCELNPNAKICRLK
jgi:hypothetical protein